MTETNWAGNHTYRPATIERPTSVDQLAEIIASSTSVGVVGTRHTFTDIGDADRLVSLGDLPERFEVTTDRRTVVIDGAMTYGRLVELLRREQLALHNLASLPHISVAGAVATGTHGSGITKGNLATAVTGSTMITPTGLHSFDAGRPDHHGSVINLGALGAVVALTLEVEPAYEVRQTAYAGLRWADLIDDPIGVLGWGTSVSVFTDWGADPGTVWVKQRTDEPEPDPPFPAVALTDDVHPVPGMTADACTPQRGTIGPWSEMLPHFRLGFTPSSGNEIQSEYFVGLDHAGPAIDALRSVGPLLAEALLISELRTVAADRLWMSPHHGRASIAFHFTWRADEQLARRAAATVEHALAPFAPRPHWGKLFTTERAASWQPTHLDRFLALATRLDPDRVFINDWFRTTFPR